MDLFSPGSLGTVTRVEEAKGLTSFYVGRKRVARVPASGSALLGVAVGSEWTEELAHRTALMEETLRALKKAVALLRVRSRSEGELHGRLVKAGFGNAAVLAAMAELKLKGLVDDRALADSVAAKAAEKGMSRTGAMKKMEARGIGALVAWDAVEQPGDNGGGTDLDRAIAAARNRQGKLHEKNAAGKYRSLLSALARLGYDEETATEAVHRVLGPPPGE